MTTSPFIRVNRPEHGGAHAEEALVLDVIDRCYRKDPVKFSRLDTVITVIEEQPAARTAS